MDHEPHEPHEHLQFREEVYRIQGAAFEVNRVLGTVFLEAAYQESLGLEFKARGIPFQAQPTLKLHYKGTALRTVYVPDFICFQSVLIELKAASGLAAEHRSQIINYLRASGLRVGLLVNFGGAGRAQIERIVH